MAWEQRWFNPQRPVRICWFTTWLMSVQHRSLTIPALFFFLLRPLSFILVPHTVVACWSFDMSAKFTSCLPPHKSGDSSSLFPGVLSYLPSGSHHSFPENPFPAHRAFTCKDNSLVWVSWIRWGKYWSDYRGRDLIRGTPVCNVCKHM